ncbi:MAG TPA: T9SS type A sorting domain-containing protein [Flavobacteriales bacterium]|nr:T9SS type A sorting domain-containing protein [Flavobacteriales bacterium]
MTAPRLFPCLMAFAICAEVCAQRTVVPAGGDASGNGGTMSWTLGQVDYIANGSASGTVAQGVQQPTEFLVLATAEQNPMTRSVHVMPNPTSDGITVQLSTTPERAATYRMLDLTGQEVATGPFIAASAYIPLAGLASSTYVIHVLHDGTETAVLRVIKD